MGMGWESVFVLRGCNYVNTNVQNQDVPVVETKEWVVSCRQE